MTVTSICQHFSCRCARADELAMMADRSGKPELLHQAKQVHQQSVPCRQVPAENVEARADQIVARFGWRARTAFAKLRDGLAVDKLEEKNLQRYGAIRWVNNRRAPDPVILAAFERMCQRRARA